MKFTQYLKATNSILNKVKVINSSELDILSIELFEDAYNIKLPGDYRKYMSLHNGGLPYNDDFYITPGEKLSKTKLLSFLSIDTNIQIDNIETYINLTLLKNNKIIPIGMDIYEGIICMSLSKSKYGNIYYSEQFEHEKTINNLIFLTKGFNNFLNILEPSNNSSEMEI